MHEAKTLEELRDHIARPGAMDNGQIRFTFSSSEVKMLLDCIDRVLKIEKYRAKWGRIEGGVKP